MIDNPFARPKLLETHQTMGSVNITSPNVFDTMFTKTMQSHRLKRVGHDPANFTTMYLVEGLHGGTCSLVHHDIRELRLGKCVNITLDGLRI